MVCKAGLIKLGSFSEVLLDYVSILIGEVYNETGLCSEVYNVWLMNKTLSSGYEILFNIRNRSSNVNRSRKPVKLQMYTPCRVTCAEYLHAKQRVRRQSGVPTN